MASRLLDSSRIDQQSDAQMKSFALNFVNVLVLRRISIPGLLILSIAVGLLAAALIPVSVH
jgi:hypothetical protein